MLEIKNISRVWGNFSLKNISLDISPGEYIVLLGPSGSGKTLLLSTIAGVYTPDNGQISLKGKDITSLPPQKRFVGYVFQKNYLFPHMSVRQNIIFGMKHHGYTKKEMSAMTGYLRNLLNLSSILDRHDTRFLSGGEAQKVALARALAIKPDLLLLDEPMSSLDYDNRNSIIETLKHVNKELKLTTIHVTHDITEAKSLAHRIITIKNGEITVLKTRS
nr:ATP-binding cassette domain-containing protein [Candidatus Omnitrophota bacterium]